MIESKLEYVDPDDPDRCQTNLKNNQCRYRKMPGLNYCPMHGGRGKAKLEQQMQEQYQLAKWQASVSGFVNDDQVKSLRQEIGVMRMLLQETINKCRSASDLMVWSPKIGDMVTKIQGLVISAHKLESSLGTMLDKTAALTLATRMVEIISEYVTDEDQLNNLSNQLISAIVGTGQEQS